MDLPRPDFILVCLIVIKKPHAFSKKSLPVPLFSNNSTCERYTRPDLNPINNIFGLLGEIYIKTIVNTKMYND